MNKPVVHYKPAPDYSIIVGCSAWIYPQDHPNHLPGHDVSNKSLAITSKVVSFDEETGDFETLNTKYKRAESVACPDNG